MNESPRPEDLGEQRTPIATEAELDDDAVDPRSEPGLGGTVARLPLWLVVGALVAIALVALYLAWDVVPRR